MKQYVLGFMFDTKGEWVGLIKKAKPEWQKGRLNGIGGKVEPTDADLNSAMIREFEEETGVRHEDWTYLGNIEERKVWDIHMFSAVSDKVFNIQTKEVEEVFTFSVKDILTADSKLAISNLPWMICFARDKMFNPRGPSRIQVIY
jgi:8-oxo-dGTP diphosphatase